MNVSLRNFKHFPSLSEETYAFEARIVIDGISRGHARNRGQGGRTELSISDVDRAKLAAYAKTLPAIPFGPDIPTMWVRETAEDVIDYLVHEQVMLKEQARLTKLFLNDYNTKLMVLLPNGTISASKPVPTLQLAELLRTKKFPAWAEKGQIINGLPLEEAKKVWFKAVVR